MFVSLSKSDSARAATRTALALLLVTAGLLARDAAAAEGTLTRPPELLEFVQAPYPAEAQAAGITGAVTLLLTIEADGAVSAVEVTEPAGHGFDAAAVEAARAFTFRPAEIDGQPAPVQIAYRYAFTLAEAPEAVSTGALVVRLVERGTRKPLAAITVRAGDAEAVSDAEGVVRFGELPEGPLRLEVRDPAFVTVEDRETIRAGEEVTVTWRLERTGFADDLEAVGRRPAKEVTRRTLSVQEIRTVPGTNGDALRVVQNLPGVARAPFGLGGLVLRGGGESRAYLEGHPIPTPFHFGLRSTVSTALIESIDLYPGNHGPEFGRGNGGIVDIRLRKPGRDGWHGYGEVDLFDAGAFLEAPVGEKGGIALGARRSYIDALVPLLLTDEQLDAFPVAPRYYDYQALYQTDLSGGHDLRFMAFGGGDRTVFLVEEPADTDPAVRGKADLELDWVGGQAEWGWRVAPDARHRLSAGYVFEAQRGALGRDLAFDYDMHRVTVRDDLEVKAAEWLKVRGGADLEVEHIRATVSLPPPTKDGETAAPVGATGVLKSDSTETWFMPAAWAELELTWGDLTVLPGVRADYWTIVDAVALQPRATARYKVTDDTTVKGGVGLYSERPDLDEVDPVFGDPSVGLERSVHYSAGVEQRLGEHLTADLVGFYKDFDDLVTRTDDADDGATGFANQGEGRAYGLEALLRLENHPRLYGWVAYTLMRSERRDAPGDDWRLFGSDQTHNVTVVGNYKLSTTWELGLRWRFVSGNPYTPIERGTYDSDADAYVPVPGAPLSRRLEPFHQLDLRVDKHWIFDAWRMTTYRDVQNAYLRQNPEGVADNFDFTEQAVIGGLPLIPSFGVRGEF